MALGPLVLLCSVQRRTADVCPTSNRDQTLWGRAFFLKFETTRLCATALLCIIRTFWRTARSATFDKSPLVVDCLRVLRYCGSTRGFLFFALTGSNSYCSVPEPSQTSLVTTT